MNVKRLTNTIRNKEMNAAILPLKRITTSTNTTSETLVFTLMGKHDELVDLQGNPSDNGYPLLYDLETETGQIIQAKTLDNAYAQLVIKGNSRRFYLKRNTSGRLFDPAGMYDENKRGKQLQLKGLEIWNFKEVNETAFTSYVNYLKSKNKAFLRNAEREVM